MSRLPARSQGRQSASDTRDAAAILMALDVYDTEGEQPPMRPPSKVA